MFGRPGRIRVGRRLGSRDRFRWYRMFNIRASAALLPGRGDGHCRRQRRRNSRHNGWRREGRRCSAARGAALSLAAVRCAGVSRLVAASAGFRVSAGRIRSLCVTNALDARRRAIGYPKVTGSRRCGSATTLVGTVAGCFAAPADADSTLCDRLLRRGSPRCVVTSHGWRRRGNRCGLFFRCEQGS